MFICPLDLDVNTSAFSPISMEVVECKKSTPSSGSGVKVMDYYLTEFPRRIDKDIVSNSRFVFTLFDNTLPAFAANQNEILEVSNKLFAGSISLTHFEEEILEKTLIRTAQKAATRPNRK